MRYLIGDGRRGWVRRRSVGETKVADQISVLGVAGSLRQGSYNKAAQGVLRLSRRPRA